MKTPQKIFFLALKHSDPKAKLGLTQLYLCNPLMLPWYDAEITVKTKQPRLPIRDISCNSLFVVAAQGTLPC